MKKILTEIPVAMLPSGDTLNIKVLTFIGKKSGKKIYIQANIHGPEIVGTAILLKLAKLIEKKKIKSGELKIVISANPIGINSKISGYQVGYTNLTSVTKYNNWNKIFKLSSNSDKNIYGVQIEDKLASILSSLSEGYDFEIDLHSAQNNIEIVYCFPHSITFANNLDVKHIIVLEDKFTGCFDEYFYFSSNKKGHSFTLELSGKTFNQNYINKWANKLYKWFEDISSSQKNKTITNIDTWYYKSDKKYYAKFSGILIPTKNPGDQYKKNEILVKILSLNGKESLVTANQSGFVYKYPNCQVVYEGEEVVEVIEGDKYVRK